MKRLDPLRILLPGGARSVSLSAVSLSVVALAALGCDAPEQRTHYPLLLRVTTPHGEALAGARANLHEELLGESGPDGLISIALAGSEGETLHIDLACPEGYRAPPPLDVSLRRFSDDALLPEYAVRCAPLEQSSVIVVRADNGSELPVLHLGREVARTDSSGAAHFVLETPPNETIELGFDTSHSPRLRPQNPTTRFRVAEGDDMVVVNQRFSLLPPQRMARHRPIRIESSR